MTTAACDYVIYALHRAHNPRPTCLTTPCRKCAHTANRLSTRSNPAWCHRNVRSVSCRSKCRIASVKRRRKTSPCSSFTRLSLARAFIAPLDACTCLLTGFLQDDLDNIAEEASKREQAARAESTALGKQHTAHEKQAVDAQSRLNDIVRSLEMQNQ